MPTAAATTAVTIPFVAAIRVDEADEPATRRLALDLLANRLNIVNSYILLYKALGGGWLTPEEEQEFLEQQQLEQQELEQQQLDQQP